MDAGFPEQRKDHMAREVGSPMGSPPVGLTRILVVAGLFPYPPTNGASMRTWSILKSLRANGHIVDLLCIGDPNDILRHGATMQQVCETVEVVPHNLQRLSAGGSFASRLTSLPSNLPFAVRRFRSSAMKDRIRAWLAQGPMDAVVCEGLHPLVNFPDQVAKPLLIDCHNVEHRIIRRYLDYEDSFAKRCYAWLELHKLRSWERRALARADLAMVCSEVDLGAMKELCPQARPLAVPNAVDTENYVPCPQGKRGRVVYTGGMDWYPNRDAVTFFCSRILPELRMLGQEVEFVVAGRGPTEEFRRQLADVPELKFAGAVPDIREEIAKAAVCVVPLRIGSGTRFKILEAAAMEKPVISTQLGAEGLEFRDGEEIILADEPREFARAVCGLLSDPQRGRELGKAARNKVEEKYSFAALRCSIRKALGELRSGPPSASQGHALEPGRERAPA